MLSAMGTVIINKNKSKGIWPKRKEDKTQNSNI